MNILDGIILAVLVWGAWRGYRQGALNALTGLAGYLVGLVVAGVYTRGVTLYLESNFGLVSSLAVKLKSALPLSAPVAQLDMGLVGTADITPLLEQTPLPGFLQDRLAGYVASPVTAMPAVKYLGDAIAQGLALMLMQAAVFLGLSFLVVVMLKLVAAFLTRGLRATPLGPVNDLLGMVVGAGVKALVLAVLLGLLVPMAALGSGGSTKGMAAVVGGSKLAQTLLALFTTLGNRLLGLF